MVSGKDACCRAGSDLLYTKVAALLLSSCELTHALAFCMTSEDTGIVLGSGVCSSSSSTCKPPPWEQEGQQLHCQHPAATPCSTGAEWADTTVALVGLSSPELFPSLGQKGLSNPASRSA